MCSGRKATLLPERTPSEMKALSLFKLVLSCGQFCLLGSEPSCNSLHCRVEKLRSQTIRVSYDPVGATHALQKPQSMDHPRKKKRQNYFGTPRVAHPPALQCGVMQRIITYYGSQIMSALKTISFRIPSDTVESLDELAESMDRDRSHVLNEAVENYLRLNEHHLKLIQKGLRAAERGDFVPDAEMKKLISRMRRAK